MRTVRWRWPGTVAGIFTAALGWRGGRVSAAALTGPVEAVLDRQRRDLAATLSGPVPAVGDGRSRTSGELLSERLRKGC